jgi:uncharacterized protein YegL
VSLLDAGALAALLLAVPLLLLHLRRGRPPEQEVASLLQWRELERPGPPSGRRLRRPLLPLLLLIQLLALTAIVFALARPAERSSSSTPSAVYVVDDSVWMGVRDGARSRLDTAVQILRTQLARAGGGTTVSVVAAGATPTVIFQGSPRGAEHALARMRPTQGPADLDGAVRLAAGLRGRAAEKVVLLRAPEDGAPRVRAATGVFTQTVIGTAVADQGLSGAVARCGLPGPVACEVFARVLNHGPGAVRDRVLLRSGARTVASRTLAVAGYSSSPISFPAAAGAALELHLVGSDALAADDAAFVAVPGGTTLHVTLVGTPAGAGPLAAALAADPGVLLRLRTPADFRPAEAARTDLLVIDGAAPAGALPDTPALALFGPQRLPGGRVAGALADGRLSGLQAGSPLLENVDLTSLALDADGARRLVLPAWMSAVAWSPGGPLVAAGADAGRRVAVLAFEPSASNLPQLAAFPVLVANIAAWSQEWVSSQALSGQAVLVADPPGLRSETLTAPSGAVRALSAQPGAAQAMSFPAPGIYTLRQAGPWGTRSRSVAVNAQTSSASPPGAPPISIGAPAAGVPERSELWRWLLAAALLALLAEWAWAAAGGGWAESDPRRVGVALRYASLALVLLALLEPLLASGATPTLLVVDRSASAGPAAAADERAWMSEAARGSCPGGCQAVQFAGGAQITSAGAGLLAARAGGPLEGTESNLERALGVALGRVPKGGRLVLLSDGRQTSGEAQSVAARAHARGVRIDVVALPGQAPDGAVTRLHAPATLHAGDPLSLEATVDESAGQSAVLTLEQDGAAIARQRVTLAAGETPLLFSLRAPAPGWHSYGLRLSQAADAFPANDVLTSALRVTAEPPVLVVGGGSPIAGILSADGMSVRRITPQELPQTARGYASQDAVVLDDVPAAALGAGRAAALTAAVHDGETGLLVLGGNHSFSLGGYAGSTLERALPVASLQPGALQRRRTAVELILDRSGSMIDEAGGVPKLEMAQVAAKASVRSLAQAGSELGIVDFDIRPHTLVPLTALTPADVAPIDRRIEALTAEGGTNIYTALAEGLRQIERSRDPVRRIVLVSDGVSEPGSYAPLLAALRRGHITVSTVALGAEADFKLLQSIARASGGNYYAAASAGELPLIFARETRLKARPVRTSGHLAVSAGASSPVLASLAGLPLPQLLGNVVTTLKPAAEAGLLAADGAHQPDPALAQWQYGLGRVVTWTPGLTEDLAGVWTRRTSLWRDAVRWVERGEGLPALTPALQAGEANTLAIDTVANAGVTLDGARPAGRLGGQPLRFTQSAPGRYTASVPGLRSGVEAYSISGAAATGGLLAVPFPAEFLPVPAAATGLGALAIATGGRVVAATDRSSIEGEATPGWWWLALAALICFLAGAAVRLLGAQTRGDAPPQRPVAAPERVAGEQTLTAAGA